MTLANDLRVVTIVTAVSTFVAFKAFQSSRQSSDSGLLVSDHSVVGTLKGDEETKKKSTFDIIIVGGGTAGCVLASRLSENPQLRVLLLEAGGSGVAQAFSRIPAGFGRLLYSSHAFTLWTEPQAHAKGRRLFWPRGKMLGGCSSINAMMAQYGSSSDFDEWAKIIGDQSWAWSNFSRFFNKFERLLPHPEYPDVDLASHGSTGPMTIGFFNRISDVSKAFVKACVAIGISYTGDFWGISKGVSRIMTYVDEKFQRVSAESAYLTPDVLRRPNLKVVTHARTTRIHFEVDGQSPPRAVSVEYAANESSPVYVSHAAKEIIVSTGAVHSPQLLMLSGIGPEKHLKERGIPVIQSLPGVGQHLRDHPNVDIFFKDKSNSSLKYFSPSNPLELIKALKANFQYKWGYGGPLATNFGECAAFVRSDDPIIFPPAEFGGALKDTCSGPESPDLELFSTPLAYKEHGRVGFDVHTFALHCYLLRPASIGSIMLKSSSPWDEPVINPNYLSDISDVQKLARGVRLLLKIARTEPLSSYLDASFTRSDLDHESHLKSEEEIMELVRERMETVYHPTSTCRMAPLDFEEGGVVDTKLRVYGVQGLRVCDASVFGEIVSGHTAAACLAVAEKLADLIQNEN